MPHAKPGGIPYARKPTGQIVSLKFLAEHLGLSQAAISLVTNRSPAAKSIPRKTYYAFAPRLQLVETLALRSIPARFYWQES